MTASTFQPSVTGITAFAEVNRIDFILDGPDMDSPERASLFFDSMNEAEVKLDGKKLSILPPERNEDGSLKYPNRLSIKWNRRVINLGFRKAASGKPSWYRSIDHGRDSVRPQNSEQLFAAMGLGQ